MSTSKFNLTPNWWASQNSPDHSLTSSKKEADAVTSVKTAVLVCKRFGQATTTDPKVALLARGQISAFWFQSDLLVPPWLPLGPERGMRQELPLSAPPTAGAEQRSL